MTEYLWVALKRSQQWAPQISLESSHLIYSPAKALKLHPLQLFHTHHPTFSTSPTLISFLRNASLHCVHQTLMSAVYGSAKCTGEHKGPLLLRGLCASSVSLPLECASSTTKRLRDTDPWASPSQNLTQSVCTFNSSPENSDWAPQRGCFKAPREQRQGRQNWSERSEESFMEEELSKTVETRQMAGIEGIVIAATQP